MRAISLWQPWAVLCVLGAKQFETRDWYTAYRGPLLIHAAKKATPDVISAIYHNDIFPVLLAFGIHGPANLSFGAIIGRVQLVACQRMSDVPRPSAREQALGDWAPGRYAWELAKPEFFAAPIPYRGAQRFFKVPSEVIA